MSDIISYCRDCGGTGLCTNCNGSGRIQCVHCDDGFIPHDTWGYDDNPFQSIEPCNYCNGTGHIPCPDCYGSGLCDICN
jgi:DnaJ-class molecular chaperone